MHENNLASERLIGAIEWRLLEASLVFSNFVGDKIKRVVGGRHGASLSARADSRTSKSQTLVDSIQTVRFSRSSPELVDSPLYETTSGRADQTLSFSHGGDALALELPTAVPSVPIDCESR